MEDRILKDYFDYIKHEKLLSDNTLQAYRRDLIQFVEYLNGSESKDYLNINKTVLIRYLMDLQKKGMSNSTISRKLASLRNLYQYLLNRGLVKEDPSLNLKSPKTEKKLPTSLSMDEVNLLLSQPNVDSFKGARDKAMLELLYATGLRVTEITSLNMEDIKKELALVVVREENEKKRAIPVGSLAMEAIEYYIENYRDEDMDLEDRAVFINHQGLRLSRQGFWKIIKYYAKKAQIEKDITPQILRHSFAVHLLENGANIKTVQQMLGHSDISTTQVYSFASNNKDLSEAYKNSHPRA